MRTVRRTELPTMSRRQLARAVDGARVRRVAAGFYMALPDKSSRDWQPTVEATALAVATTLFGGGVPVLMGLSAARFHHAVPHSEPLGHAMIAIPSHHRQLRLSDGAVVRFATRDPEKLDARRESFDYLGTALVTTPEQTVLDLMRHSGPRLELELAQHAIKRLLRRCRRHVLSDLAETQNLPTRAHNSG